MAVGQNEARLNSLYFDERQRALIELSKGAQWRSELQSRVEG